MEKVKHQIKVLAFGMVAEKMQTATLELEGIPNTDVLKGYLYQQFPQLEDIRFCISVDRQVVTGNHAIPADAEIALLPPFSGG